MQTRQDLRKEARKLVQVLNSSAPNWDKYPFGNKELMAKTIDLEAKNLLRYNKLFGTWRAT